MRAQSLASADQRLGPEQMHCMEVWSGNTAIDKWFELPVTVHGPEGRDTVIWRASPPPTPPHNVADLSESVIANSFAATLRGGGHAPPRERLQLELRRAADNTTLAQLHSTAETGGPDRESG
jgi:hypothetical protein